MPGTEVGRTRHGRRVNARWQREHLAYDPAGDLARYGLRRPVDPDLPREIVAWTREPLDGRT